jgi:hypothetical protein
VDAPWYVSNSVIRKDLQIPTVKEEISRFISLYAVRFRAHTNELTATLTEPPVHKRLSRYWPNDLLTRFWPIFVLVTLVCKFRFPAVSTGFRTPYLQRSTTEYSSTSHPITLSHHLLNVILQLANKLGLLKKCTFGHFQHVFSLRGFEYLYKTEAQPRRTTLLFHVVSFNRTTGYTFSLHTLLDPRLDFSTAACLVRRFTSTLSLGS